MGTIVLSKQPCEACGSSDGLHVYDDGSYCFSCGKTSNTRGDHVEDTSSLKTTYDFLQGTYKDIPSRSLTEETCRKWGYSIGPDCHIATFRDDKGAIVYQKVRKAGKNFLSIGDPKDATLYGQSLWASPGKSVVITEGELDALSVSQAFGNKWPVVSLPNGAKSASKAIGKAYEWLAGFEKIVLCFDMDAPGQEATQLVAEMLPVGQVYIMRQPEGCKDANETLTKLGPAAITKAYWSAQVWRPDGIVSGHDITVERLKTAQARGYSLRYSRLDELLGGLRERELTILTAGTGIGKSTIAREIAYGLLKDHGLTIGNMYLEESVEKTAQGYIAIDNNVPLGVLRKDPETLSPDKWEESLSTVVKPMHFFNHFGSLDSDRLISKIRYMRMVLKCHFVILDHISIVISGQTSSSEGERRDIDVLMTKLRSLIEETGVGIVAIVHLKQPEGKAHEEGGRVTLSQLRGSGSLKQIPDSVIALERNQQGDDSNSALIRILKNREFGDLGEADTLTYDRTTGRLLETGGDF